jgi:hypothetical protein
MICPPPVEIERSQPFSIKDRLARARAQQRGVEDNTPKSIVELLRLLGHPESKERLDAQKALQVHPDSWLTWKINRQTRTGPWFVGVLHLSCLTIWRNKPHGTLNDVDELINEVWVNYRNQLEPDTAPRFRWAYGAKPWLGLCSHLRLIAVSKLVEGKPPRVQDIAEPTVTDLERTFSLLSATRASLSSGEPVPTWLTSIAEDLPDSEVMDVLDALLRTDRVGTWLMLNERQDTLARKILRLNPQSLDLTDLDDEEDIDER